MVAKIKYILLSLPLLLLAFTSCEKYTIDDIEGKWQLKEMVVAGETFRVDTVFYNFQNTLFMLQVLGNNDLEYKYRYGYKIREDNKLSLEIIHFPGDYNVFLEKTDWKSPLRDFLIEKVSGSELILTGDDKRYIFLKF